MTNYKIYYGIEELHRLNTCVNIAFDTETLQLQPEKGKLRLIQLGCKVRECIVIIDCFELEEKDWETLDRFFTNGERFWLAHNAVFDIAWLQEYDIYPRGRINCTMIASRLLTNGIPQMKHGLSSLTERHLGIETAKEQQLSDWSKTVLDKEQLEYAAKDVEVLLEMDLTLQKKLEIGKLKLAYSLECKAIPALAQMWRTGLPWNRESLEKCREDYAFDANEMGKNVIRQLDAALPDDMKLPREGDEAITILEDKLSEMDHDPRQRVKWEEELAALKEEREGASFNLRSKEEGSKRLGTKKYKGFNINSPKQLLEKFTAILGKQPVDANDKPSASRQALRSYAADHEVISSYLNWKKMEKRRQMITSIQEAMGEDGFVRASYRQLGADTGRMSCVKPNNQQIPRDKAFRQCVEAPKGWVLVDADFSQMELRLAASLANDRLMINSFIREEDLHQQTADAMKCSRDIAKSANFGLLYGAGAEGLRNYAGASGITMTTEEATQIRDKWIQTFDGIRKWQGKNARAARDTEMDEKPSIRIPLTGMRRFLIGDLNKVTVRCNTPIQGAGAAILKCALGNIWPHIREAGEDTVQIAAAIHDEILLLVKEGEENKWAALLKEMMEKAEAKWLGDIPPLAEVHIGKTWEEVH